MAKQKLSFVIKETRNKKFTWSIRTGNNEITVSSQPLKRKQSARNIILRLCWLISQHEPGVSFDSLIVDKTVIKKPVKKKHAGTNR